MQSCIKLTVTDLAKGRGAVIFTGVTYYIKKRYSVKTEFNERNGVYGKKTFQA